MDRRRRRGDDSRILAFLCLASAVLCVPFGLLLGIATGRWFTAAVFLALTALLAVPYLLFRRDSRLRQQSARDRAGRSAARPSGSDGTGAAPGSEIVVTRPAGYHQDSLRGYRVLVDGSPAGRIRSGGTLRHPVAPGRHEVVARIDWSGSPAVEVDVPPGGAVHLTVAPAGRLITGVLTRDRWVNLEVDA